MALKSHGAQAWPGPLPIVGCASTGPGTSVRVAEGGMREERKKMPNTFLIRAVARPQVAVTAS